MHLFLVGAGHVGLVTAVGFARLGHSVTVADIDGLRIEGLQAGEPPIFEPGLREGLAAMADRLAFTTDLGPPPDAAYSFVAVPTPTDEHGPLATTHVQDAIGRLLERTDAAHTIVIRSTLPLAGPDRLMALRGGRPDAAALVTNPEFMREGNGLHDFEHPGRIVTGWIEPRDEAAARAVLELYAGIEAPRIAADARSVALIKLASNVFLAMKVAYGNELARLADAYGANARTVADGIGLDERIGRAFLDAGPGFGGSCLPEQATALSEIAAASAVPAPLIDAVGRSNRVHQGALVTRLGALLGGAPGAEAAALRGRRVAIFGLAFKANTDDVRESPALAIAGRLRQAGATPVGTDPRAEARARRDDPELAIAASPLEAARGAAAVVITTEWAEYRDLDWAAIAAVMDGDVVFDTRNVADREAIRGAGLRAAALGRA
jgi:UDPglucose 6-dehydrogenase